MPKCTPCLSKEYKKAIIGAYPEATDILGEIANCKPGIEIQMCKGRGKGGREKRAPSAYNMFVAECFKRSGGVKGFGEAGPMMKKCAAEWKGRRRT